MSKKLPRIDKTALIVTGLNDTSEEKNYWHNKTGVERLNAVELNRKMVYGNDRVASRLQRFLEVIELSQR